MLRRRRPGFTLLELLVVIGIVSVLMGLLLPAVQAARSAAHGILCRSNLRQLAQAVHGYHEIHGMVPGWVQVSDSTSVPNSEFSVLSAILPMLDQAVLYDQLNHVSGLPSVHVFSPSAWSAHATVAFARVGVFLCPADSAPSGWSGAVNYRGNWGVGPYNWTSAEFLDSGNGFFSGIPVYPRRFAHVFDGLQNTAMFSERIVGNGSDEPPFSLRNVVEAPVDSDRFRDADAALRICAVFSGAGASSAGVYPFPGKYWLFTGIHQTLYNHSLGPNSLITDCQLLALMTEPVGACAARSLHADGVNVAFGDGSVRFVSNSVALAVWRAYGSRDGHEVVRD